MTGTTESIESFRARARAWLADNMPRLDTDAARLSGDDPAHWDRARELQRRLHAGGFAGICFPEEYGGLGLPHSYQQAFSEEAEGYEMPIVLNIPSFSICCATLLDVGSEEQKREHIGAAIRGEEVLCQFLSEPSGGSDLAGLITRAERDGENWVVNGAKIWSTFAYGADYGLCLARTDPEKPKHDGLTMFLMPTRAPGLTMNRIRMADGTDEFCEEFFDNVVLGPEHVVGRVNDGWTVASRQLYHERTAVGGGSIYTSGYAQPPTRPRPDIVDLVRRTGRAADPDVRRTVGEAIVMSTVHEQLVERVSAGIGGGHLPPTAASVPRLFHAEESEAHADALVRAAGASVAVASAGNAFQDVGLHYLCRQAGSLGGGSSEMARNLISERLLGMPREQAADRGMPFNQIRRGAR
ncbi:acyl-CoA dehydrogenase family protein [Actinomadura sp. NTSP31]|uniref:acyl-CoA dehydrogenase family protein n=1 Tax=Actinomadura sp. NTSP31 TaxID=1735447 RepID=UPI0035C265FF